MCVLVGLSTIDKLEVFYIDSLLSADSHKCSNDAVSGGQKPLRLAGHMKPSILW